MHGWKTWVGAIGIFAGGIVMVASGLIKEPVDPNLIYQGGAACFGAFAAVGLGHKIEKNK